MKYKIPMLQQNFLWSFVVFFSWLPCIAYTIGTYKLVSVGTYGTAGMFTIYFLKNLNLNRVKWTTLLFCFFQSFIFVYFLFKWRFMIEDGLRDSFYLVIILFMFILCSNKPFTNDMRHIVYVLPGVTVVIMAIVSLFPSSYDLNLYGNALYLNFQNPNILSFVLLMIIIFEGLGFIAENKNRYLLFMMIAFLLLVLTHSRTSLVSAIVFILCMGLKKRIYKIPVWLSVVISNIPIIAVFCVLSTKFVNISLFGKSGISGRDLIWENIIYTISKNRKFLWFGKGKYLWNYNNPFFDNAHNAYMQYICNFGILVFILILMCVIVINIKASKNLNDKYSFLAYIGSMAILVNCSFETHIADAIIGMSIMWLVLYWEIISRGDTNDNNIKTVENERVNKNKKS